MNQPAPDLPTTGAPTDAEVWLVHREVVLLLMLVAAAAAGFLVTRSAASVDRSIRLADARQWHARGLAARDADSLEVAVTSLRRAVTMDRDNSRYVLDLADALWAANRPQEARELLSSLRVREPDDAEINLRLARLEAVGSDLDAAVRFYQAAIAALWPESEGERRRAIRFELVELLLARQHRSRALSELILLAADSPEDESSQVRLGQLMLQAGDAARASAIFTRVLEAAPRNAAALSGAGEAAFALADYALALRYLSAAPGDVGADLRSTAAAVLSRDPLQPRLGAAERRRRITAVLTDVVGAADSCLAGRVPPDDAATAAVRQRRDEAVRTPWLTAGPRRPAVPADRDDLEDALVLAARLADGLAEAGCPSGALQRALPLIAKRHELALQ